MNYKCRLEVLGPLFVGSGEKIEKAEYIHDRTSNRIYVMDSVKMFNGLQKRKLLNKFQDSVMNAERGVNLYNFIRDNNIQSSEYSKWARYSYEVDSSIDLRQTQIMACMKDAYNMPYIPGSSLKGAIRNCILNAMLLQTNRFESTAVAVETEEYDRRNIYLSKIAKKLDADLFHTLERDEKNRNNAVNSIFQGLRVSDSKPLPIDKIVLCQKIDVLPDGKRNPLNVQRECIAPGTVIEFDIEIDTNFFPFDGEDICNFIKAMYDNERKCFLSAFPNVQTENGNLLYLGGGTGYVSKTAVYSLFKEKIRAVKNAGKILDKVDSTVKKRGRTVKVGNHLEDLKTYKVSPHTRKCTLYKKKLYDFGLCRLDFQPMTQASRL